MSVYSLRISSLLLCFSVLLNLIATAQAEEKAGGFQELKRFPAQEAHQAVAVDKDSVYAISSRSIARYRKADGSQLKSWTGPKDSHIKHLNSGVVIDGKLYCAHSNWPASPLKNTLEIFDAQSLTHQETRQFPDTVGAINWIDRRGGKWWIAFAFYGKLDNVRQTRVVRYNDDWQPEVIYTFPDSVLKRFLPNSNSGGGWGPDGRLYTTGHDHGELYVLELPESGTMLKHITTLPAPITGQGIAWDPTSPGTLYGINRRQKQVIIMQSPKQN